MLDVIIRGGTLFDGSGRGGSKLDLGVRNGQVEVIGELDSAEAATVIDAEGLYMAPGFIDTHSHSDLRLLYGEPPDVKLTQGVTTEVLGQDGLSVAPIVARDVPLYRKLLAGLLGDPEIEWTWRSTAEYLDALDNRQMPLNAAYLIPHGPIRSAVMGMEDRHAKTDELFRMRPILRQALDEGGVGFSTGLIYPPCSYADAQELIDLCRVAASQDVPLVVHMRNEGIGLLQAIDEMLLVARESGVHLHISHLKLFGKKVWDQASPMLQKLAAARAEGVRITADQYPYFAGCTILTSVLPQWSLGGGTEALIARLKDPDIRQKIKEWAKSPENPRENRTASIGWENIVVSWVKSEQNKQFEGKSIAEISEIRGSDEIDTVCDLLLEENLAVTQISFYGTEETITPIMSDPWVMFCTDGIYGGKPHPRLYGSFPRILGHYVREQGILSMPEAIRKMTSLPAWTFHLERRGLLKPGYVADVTVFCPDSIIDNATFEHSSRLSTGVKWVLVNGTPVIEDGVYNGKTPGRAIRRVPGDSK